MTTIGTNAAPADDEFAPWTHAGDNDLWAPSLEIVVIEAASALLIYDGDCAFCTTVARWAEGSLTHGERVVSWQRLGAEGLAHQGLSERQVSDAAWWIDAAGRKFRGHRAIGKALRAMGGPAAVAGAMFLVPPSSWLAALDYRGVVRLRHRLPGATDACHIER